MVNYKSSHRYLTFDSAPTAASTMALRFLRYVFLMSSLTRIAEVELALQKVKGIRWSLIQILLNV